MRGAILTGHVSKDYPRGSFPICFHYCQVVHKKAGCPRLLGGAESAPALVTLRITNGHEGKAESPTMRSQAL